MLVMSRAPQKTTRAYSRPIRGRKSYLRSSPIQCYLYLILNGHFFSFLTEAGTHFFILSCISAHLPKTEASNWEFVIRDLELLKDLTNKTDISSLYTESDAHPSCKITMLSCFLQELHVISYESNNDEINQTVENIIILASSTLSSDENKAESGCKECEELEEKNVGEFLKSFTHMVQSFIGTA